MSKKIQDCILPGTKVVAGIGVLGIPEWRQIQAFSDSSIFLNPSTRKQMEVAIGFKDKDTWEPKFDSVIADYGHLKVDCELFETKVKKEMLGTADDLCEYSTLCKTVYSRLSTWMYDFPIDGVDNGDFGKKFEVLANGAWGKAAQISPEAETLKGRFTKFLSQLQNEATEKKKRVDAVTENLEIFEASLKSREAAFKQHKANFTTSIATFKEKIETLRGKIRTKQDDVVREEKADYDKIMVLKTSPVYLAIPIFGPFIMAAILLGVGTATGVLRKQLEGLVGEARALKEEMGDKVTQMTHTESVAHLVTNTLTSIQLIKPEVKKLSLGWGALAAEVGNVLKYVSGSLTKAELNDWDASGMSLENATSEWMNVYKKADMLRQFSGIKSAATIAEAIESAKQAA